LNYACALQSSTLPRHARVAIAAANDSPVAFASKRWLRCPTAVDASYWLAIVVLSQGERRMVAICT
jgi:hypothetical protein